MIKYKINIKDALERVGFGVYDARKTGYIAQDTLRKLMREETGVTLEAINRLCVILDMDVKDVITWEMDSAEEERRKDIMQQTASKKNRGWERRRRAAGSSVAAGEQPKNFLSFCKKLLTGSKISDNIYLSKGQEPKTKTKGRQSRKGEEYERIRKRADHGAVRSRGIEKD